MGIRQGVEKDAVDDGKQRGVCGYAEGQGEDGDGGKARRLREHAAGVAKVLQKGAHDVLRSDGRKGLGTAAFAGC